MKSILLVVAAAACGGGQKDVAVEGNDTELVKLAGDWQGEYKGKESGRTGTVSFSLAIGRRTLGDVRNQDRHDGTDPDRVMDRDPKSLTVRLLTLR
jgi:hypothetical protein